MTRAELLQPVIDRSPKRLAWKPDGQSLRPSTLAMLVFAVTRIIALGTAGILVGHGRFASIHQTFWQFMTRYWDGGIYDRIAAHGYTSTVYYRWFPGYPLVMDLISWLTGAAAAGVIVVIIAGFVAAAGLMRLGMLLTSDSRISLLLVALWAVAPGAIVLSMTYSEALFSALAVWALVALVERRWLTAGVLTLAAGAVHSTAVVLMAAVGVAALIAVIQAPRATWFQESWRPIAAVVMAPLGLLGFFTFAGVAQGHFTAWVTDEKAGGMSFDWGVTTVRMIKYTLLWWPRPFVVLTVLVLIAAVMLMLWTLTERIPVYLYVYTVGVVILALGTNAYYMGSKPRLLLPAFLLALPLARILAPVRNIVLIPLIIILALASAWFSLFLMSIGWAP
jgi:Mannosyltransferase (PIG-V)